MQLFNEINSRKLNGEFNVFHGFFSNYYFLAILVGTACLQILMIQFGAEAFAVVSGGLSWSRWGVCIALGAGSLPVQQVVNVVRVLWDGRRGGGSL